MSSYWNFLAKISDRNSFRTSPNFISYHSEIFANQCKSIWTNPKIVFRIIRESSDRNSFRTNPIFNKSFWNLCQPMWIYTNQFENSFQSRLIQIAWKLIKHWLIRIGNLTKIYSDKSLGFDTRINFQTICMKQDWKIFRVESD